MRALVVFAHPVPESFSAALHEKVVARLKPMAGTWMIVI